MRFTDFLRATVMTSAGAATVLAAITVLAASTQGSDLLVVFVSAVWWVVATAIGSTLGRRGETNPPIAKLLAAARFQTVLPELHPGRTLINRLWPLLLCTIAVTASSCRRHASAQMIAKPHAIPGTWGAITASAPAAIVHSSSGHKRLSSVRPGCSSGSTV